ncbi:ribosomal protein L4 domain-containing protein [Phaeosphaeriaceae sp. PMI808]|nr:ribosomal protein L4 domain-containing protein [Phaeosphaeriaceae sp. PMI808]
MASTRISAPMRGVAYQLSRSYTTSSITTSTSSTPSYVPITPFEDQTVVATMHRFPSLEPLRFEAYPANHLNLPTRRDILHRAVVYEGDKTRLGTASTKNRYEVRGSARKVRPQKGSGKARLGDKNSPMLRGGGVAFGPRPRDFATGLQKKVYDLAWRTALSYRFRKGELIIVDNAMEIESPSTKLLEDIFTHHKKILGKGRSLLVTLEERPLLEDALGQMDRGQQTLTWEEVDVKNLLELSRVIIERDALYNILLSHQEDLTHTSLPPRHKSLIRSSPPSELENITGWAEFRDLQLTPRKEQDAARPTAYENVALKQYHLAAALPENSIQRSDLTISAYNLLAEAKELQFVQLTSMSFADYAQLAPEDAVEQFPCILALKYQHEVKLDAATQASETSRLEGDVLELEARALEIQQFEIQYDAVLLAAQVHEHFAEAQRLSGDEEGADNLRDLAGGERMMIEELATQVLEHQLALATLRVRVEKARRNSAARKEAQGEVDALTAQLEARKAEQDAGQEAVDGEEEGEVLEVPAAVVEEVPAPAAEQVKKQDK